MTDQGNVVSMMDRDPLIQSLREGIGLGLDAQSAWEGFALAVAPEFPKCKPAEEARLHEIVAQALRISGAKNLNELCARLDAEARK